MENQIFPARNAAVSLLKILQVNTPPAESRWLRLTAKAGVVSVADTFSVHRQF